MRYGRKLCFVILMTLLLTIMLSSCGALKSRDAFSSPSFTASMEALDLEVQDVTDLANENGPLDLIDLSGGTMVRIFEYSYSSGGSDSNEPVIPENVNTALEARGDDYSVFYIVLLNDNEAKGLFEGIKDFYSEHPDLENYRRGSTLNMPKIQRYYRETREHYGFVSRVENTIICFLAPLEEGNDLITFIQTTDYY